MSTVPECWHGDVCPWHKRGRCLFKHCTPPPVGLTGGEVPVEQQLRDLRRALQRLAAAVMWRDGVLMPQVMKDTLETMENTPKERISECTPEQFFDAIDEPVPRFQDDLMVKQKLQAEAKEWAAAFPRGLQDDGSAVDLAEVPDRVSAASAASRCMYRSLICQGLRLAQVTRTVEMRVDQACPGDNVALNIEGLDQDNVPRTVEMRHQRVDQERISEHTLENIVDVPVPWILKEIVEAADAVRRQSCGCAWTVTGDDSSEESDCGSDRSSIFDGLMVNLHGNAEQEDPQVEEVSSSWMGDLTRSSWRQSKSATKWARYRGWRKEGHDSWSWAGDGQTSF